MDGIGATTPRGAWNKDKLVGQKAPFKLQEIWAIRIRLQMQGRLRDLALFDLGIDSKLRACDLVKLRVRDVCHGDRLAARAMVFQQKTQRPVRFEITPPTREALEAWIKSAGLKSDGFLFPSPVHASPHLGTRQYARIVHDWVEEIGLDPTAYGTHSMRRTKPTLIYRRTKNLRAVQLSRRGDDGTDRAKPCPRHPALRCMSGRHTGRDTWRTRRARATHQRPSPFVHNRSLLKDIQ